MSAWRRGAGLGVDRFPMASDSSDFEPLVLAELITRTLFDARGVQRPIDETSRLAAEIAGAADETSRHFLGELPRHSGMLVAAVLDGLTALDRLDSETPFSGILVARGVLEAGADLYWLSNPEIDAVERARRAFLIFLTQHETRVRQLEALRNRARGAPEVLSVLSSPGTLDVAIDEGWKSLKQHAEAMASAGHELRTSNRVGHKYTLGDPKPVIAKLVEKLVRDHVGVTAVPIYSLYSSVAHAEGEGLGSLLMMDDLIETPDGPYYRYAMDERRWSERLLKPATAAASGAFNAWANLTQARR